MRVTTRRHFRREVLGQSTLEAAFAQNERNSVVPRKALRSEKNETGIEPRPLPRPHHRWVDNETALIGPRRLSGRQFSPVSRAVSPATSAQRRGVVPAARLVRVPNWKRGNVRVVWVTFSGDGSRATCHALDRGGRSTENPSPARSAQSHASARTFREVPLTGIRSPPRTATCGQRPGQMMIASWWKDNRDKDRDGPFYI